MRGLRIAAILLVAAAMAGCATRAPAHQPASKAVITASPTPTPVAQPSEADLIAGCTGKAVTGAADIGGVVHPTVVVENGSIDATYKINESFKTWLTPVQLVVCLGAHKVVQVKDCGNVTRTWTTGTSQTGRIHYHAAGRLYLLQDQQAVTVVTARTGKTIITSTIGGQLLTCGQVLADYGNPEIQFEGQTTTWRITGLPADAANVDEWANALVIRQFATPSPAAVKS